MKDALNSLIDRISTYQILNFLYPGALFLGAFGYCGLGNLFTLNIIMLLVLCYFIGMTISRIGSLVIEELMKHWKWIDRIDYQKQIEKEKTDDKIELLLSLSNTFRTLAALCLTLLIIFLFDVHFTKVLEVSWWMFLVLAFLLVIYIFSFRKQYIYLCNRVECN